MKSGSSKIVLASSNVTSCLARLLAAFAASHSKRMAVPTAPSQEQPQRWLDPATADLRVHLAGRNASPQAACPPQATTVVRVSQLPMASQLSWQVQKQLLGQTVMQLVSGSEQPVPPPTFARPP